MRIRALGALAIAALLTATIGCGAGGFLRPYEYEEEMYLSLDGSATVYVNSSLAALDALRGTSFETGSRARIDRDEVARYFETPVTHVSGRIGTSRRSNRQYVHVRVDVPDVRRLHEAAPFAWSTYRLTRDSSLYRYTQQVGAPASRASSAAGWDGREVVAFRLHLPSKITYHNTGTSPRRGNILVWEQPLADRLRGVPLTLEARMETQSILYRTLWLFGATFVAVAVSFGLLLWWILRHGAREQANLKV
ncbi:MAG TPA: hypothetical protein VHU82_10115 [Vicinamibacterales bacterium]|jgi:hypothetical protein|nr:hypothetical protein [Vicinamibacterales bacterium]